MKKFVPHLISVAIFIAISSIYFSPVFEGKVLSAHDIDTWKGMSKEVVDFRKSTGQEALWTKRMFSGMPAYQISTRSNGNLIQYIDKVFRLGLPRPIDMLFLYLIGFYILLCTLKINYKLAIVGAIAFAFSSYFIIILQAGHMTKAHAIAYLPLIIASVLYVFRSEKWLLGAVFTSLFVALQLYSNHYQITYYTVIILFFIGVVQFVKQLQDKTLPSFFKKTGILVVAALLGAATNYTRLSTTMEYGPETQRGKSELVSVDGKEKKDGLGLEYATRWSYGKSETMTFLIPNFMGGSTGKSVLEDNESETLKYLRTIRNQKKQQKLQQQTLSYWGNQPGTSPTYVGAIIMFLFVLGILYVKSPLRIWILLATILSIMLAWGHNFMGLTEFFFNYIPYYNKFRAVTMAMIIAEFGIVLLAILALNKFLNKEDNKEKEQKLKLAFYITGGITLIFALFPSIPVDFLSKSENDKIEEFSQQIFELDSLSSFALLDTTTNNYRKESLVQLYQSKSIKLKKSKSNYLDFSSKLALDRKSILKSDAWRSFIFILLSVFMLWLFIKGNIKKQYVVFILGFLILTDMWSVDKRYLNETHFVEFKKSEFDSSDADDFIINQNKDHSRVFNLNNPFNESTTSYHHNSIGGYHAAKLLRYQELIDYQLSPELQRIITNLQNQRVHEFSNVLNMLNTKYIIYNPKLEPIINQNTLGNAWFVSEINTVDNANEEIESLNSFNPKTTAILDKRFSQNITDFTLNPDATIKLNQKQSQPNHLIYNLSNVTSTQLVVFSEIYYEKGWNAYIDGEIVPHFRANYVLRSMMVPKGTTKIEFKFEPSSYSTGETVAYASSILLLLLLGFVSYKELK